MANADMPEPDSSPIEMSVDFEAGMFLKHYYPETKDLAKHFLTLISGSIVFSITFAEKIVNFSQAPELAKYVLLSAWAFLIIALGACGLGLYLSFVAAEQAAGSLIYDYGRPFKAFARLSYLWLDVAGVFFGIGLAAMVAAAAIQALASTPVWR